MFSLRRSPDVFLSFCSREQTWLLLRWQSTTPERASSISRNLSWTWESGFCSRYDTGRESAGRESLEGRNPISELPRTIRETCRATERCDWHRKLSLLGSKLCQGWLSYQSKPKTCRKQKNDFVFFRPNCGKNLHHHDITVFRRSETRSESLIFFCCCCCCCFFPEALATLSSLTSVMNRDC